MPVDQESIQEKLQPEEPIKKKKKRRKKKTKKKSNFAFWFTLIGAIVGGAICLGFVWIVVTNWAT